MYTAQSLYGQSAQAPSYAPSTVAAPTQRMGTNGTMAGGWKALVDHNNPLFWLGMVGAVTLGLAGLSGNVRLGRAKLSASLDKA